MADLPEDENYSVSLYVRPGRLQILPAELTVKTGSAEKPYDGEALTNSEASLEGLVEADKDKVTVAATGSQTEVGSSENTYEITWGDVNSNNYKITEKLGTLEVTKPELILTIKDAKATYNGKTQYGYSFTSATGTGETIDNAEYTIEGLCAGDVLTVTYTPAKGMNAATYENGSFADTYTIVNSDGDDVTASYESVTLNPGKLTINPLEVTVTITGNKENKVYNGEEQKVEGYTATADSELYNVNSDIKFIGEAVAERTVVGTTYMDLEEDYFENTNDNFTVTFSVTDGSLTITPAQLTIAVNDQAYTYNGEPQGEADPAYDDPAVIAERSRWMDFRAMMR